ncbi:MAG: epimerase [Acidovorax sp.]|nr:MAG: epimerase [Acidovorax sp.]
MSPLPRATERLLRWSLIAVWLITAAVSVWELHGQSRDLLAGLPAAWNTSGVATALILAGAAADAALGVWMAWRPGRVAYAAALLLMAAMTVLATVIQPDLWLHPLGPLTKNLPIAAILWVLLQGTPLAARMSKP